MEKRNDHAMTIVFWVTGSLVTLSLFLEHLMGLSPCYLCLKERSIHMILCVASLILMRTSVPHRLGLGLLWGGVLASMLLAGAHAGFEYGWWYLDLPCQADLSLPMSLGQMQDQLNLKAPPRCDEPALVFAGLSLAGANFLISLGILVLLSKALMRSAPQSS